MPRRAPLNFKTVSTEGRKLAVTFESEPGLTVPGVVWLPDGAPKGAVVLVSEGGKIAAAKEFNVPALVAAGYACLAIDARGTGELEGLDIRLMTYLGTAPAFAMAVDAAAAVEAMRRYSSKIAVLGAGLGGAQVPMFAALMERIKNDAVEHLFKIQVVKDQPAPTPRPAAAPPPQKLQFSRGDAPAQSKTAHRDVQKVGRNDPCPCGSGKKYKKCHGQ